MIKINLLPPELAAKKAAGAAKGAPAAPKSPLLVIGVVLLLLYAVGGYMGYLVYSSGVESDRKLAQERAKKEKKQKELQRLEKELAAAAADREEIEARYEVAKALNPDNRIYWSEKLNMLAKARMDLAVYVTKLSLNEQVDEVETPESAKRREEWRKKKPAGVPEPAPIKRPIINQSLTIDAIAYGRDSQEKLNNVIAFQFALRNLKWRRESGEIVRFMDGMNNDFGQLRQKTDMVGGVEVLRFGVVVHAEPQTYTGEQSQSASTTAKGGSSK